MVKAIEYYNQAISRFTSKEELFHLLCLRNAAQAHLKAEQRIGKMELSSRNDFFAMPGENY